MATSTLPRPQQRPAVDNRAGASAGGPHAGSPPGAGERRAAANAGAVALCGLVAAMALLAVATASAPSSAVAQAAPHFFPGWLAGPLRGLGLETSTTGLELLVIAICACYAVALRCAGAISARRLWSAIVLAHLAALLAPPLFSGDVFGYIGFARLDVVHGLSPYVYTAAAAPSDPIYHLLGWTTLTTPYGPLFTLLSDALVPLGIAGGLWAFKSIAALASLATVVLIWRAAARLGRSRRRAIAFYGLNPLVLVFAVPGAHNEALIGMLVAAGALCLVAGEEVRGGLSLVAATAVKTSAALVLPFALLGSRRRGRVAASMAAGLLIAGAVAWIAFGPHLFGVSGALSEQGRVSGHSLPAEVSQLLGAGQLALSVRVVFLVAFGGVLVAMLWRCWRGAHWLDCYGWATLALLASTAWLVPWYGLWALLPASLSSSRRLRLATLIGCVYLVAIRIAIQNPLSAA
ncbi:MAG: glycosyltransferase family 87 protein [Solirubrobacteraceae bacterium]